MPLSFKATYEDLVATLDRARRTYTALGGWCAERSRNERESGEGLEEHCWWLKVVR